MKRALLGSLLLLAVLSVAGGVVVYCAEWIFVPAPAPYDVSVGPVELLPPGTVIGDSAPPGWTHLIIKSRPCIASGAVDRLGPTEVRYGTFLFMTTVARVVPKRSTLHTRYSLEAIAIGLGTTVGGQDTVLSPEKQKGLGANLGWIFRLILSGAYKQQQRAHLVARSPTFALLDTPALMLRRSRHVDVTLRYALLVDSGSGQLDTLVWLIDREDPESVVPGPMEWLPRSKLEQAPLHVDDREFTPFVGPGPRAYAVERIPQGDCSLAVPASLQALAGQERFTTDQAVQLHQALRQLLRTQATERTGS